MKIAKTLVALTLALVMALGLMATAGAEPRTDLVFALYSEPSAMCGGFAAAVTKCAAASCTKKSPFRKVFSADKFPVPDKVKQPGTQA